MRKAYELQALTRAAPDVSAPAESAVLSLADMAVHKLVVEAPAGCKLAGAGTMRCWLRHRATGNYLRAPDFDSQVSVSGVQGQAFPEVAGLLQQADAAFYASDGVTLSGSATSPDEADKVKVYLYGEVRR